METGAEMKIGNVILLSLHSAVVMDYMEHAAAYNAANSAEEDKIRVFSAATYRRMLKVNIVVNVRYSLKWAGLRVNLSFKFILLNFPKLLKMNFSDQLQLNLILRMLKKKISLES